ncbi:MAG: secretin N-terminal domain-containing protein [Chlamydiota bacterium]
MKIKTGILSLLCIVALHGQTIEEKREALLMRQEGEGLPGYLNEVNAKLKQLRSSMEEKYRRVNEYYRKDAREEDYHLLLGEVNQIRAEIADLEKEWHDLAVSQAKKDDESYGLWDQEETTLTRLIMEYGSYDYLYIIPPEILSMKLHIHSAIPVPRESWSDLLEIILSHNGIGVKQLNSYTRQLYILKQDLVAVDQILNDPIDLIGIPPKMRVVYVFSPPPERIKGVSQFFERFRDPKMTFIYQVGYKIAIISSKEEIEKLLTLYEAVWEKENEKLTRVLPLTRLNPSEMEQILNAYFGNLTGRPRIGLTKGEGEDLMIIPLAGEGSLVLIGPKDMIERAEALVRETEGQIEDPTAMTVYWYNCRHSDPIDLAEVLEKVYTALIYSGVEGQEPTPEMQPLSPTGADEATFEPRLSPPIYGSSPYSAVAHPPPTVAATVEVRKEKSYTTNFIPYPKTGAIMMVVRRDTLDKLKELIRNLDVPKKMVQIEVLLFEKRIKNHNNFGLNLLRLGSAATDSHETGIRYETGSGVARKGIADFFIFRKKPNDLWPAFDIAYNFLMAQEDVRINAAPTVTTLNQTPAQIALVEEISIDNGVAPVNTSNGTISYQQTFSRAQYGTTIVITPTIHEPERLEDDKHFVTLETNVTFDTIKKNVQNDRPAVSKRHIENHVRVVDGETVILGGLREKTAEDSSSKLPFLGELPGLGKFFGDSKMTDEKTEMFFFITPHIIFDAKGEMNKLRREQLTKRPGDLPEFLENMEKAKKRDKKRFFENSLKLLFGKVHG